MKKTSKRYVKGSSKPKSRVQAATAAGAVSRNRVKPVPGENRGSPPLSAPPTNSRNDSPASDDRLHGLRVSRIRTDSETEAYLFEAGEKKMAISSEQMLMDRRTAICRVQEGLGVNLVPSTARKTLEKRIEEAEPSLDVLAVTRPGFDTRKEYSDRPQFYAYGNGTIIAADEAPACVSALPPSDKFQQRGDADVFTAELAKIVSGQAIPLLVLFFGLAPILLRFCRRAGFMVENAILELTGKTTSNKSTLTVLMAGSLWGGASRSKLGFADSWNTTANRIEELALIHNDALLILDEATVAEKSSKDRGAALLAVIHRINQGRTRGRMGSDVGDFQVLILSTSNEPLVSILHDSANVVGGATVRAITISCPSRETGLFDTLPKGYSSLEAAMNALRLICSQNYGHVAPRLIQAVVNWSARDPDALVDYVHKRMDYFLRAVGADPATAAALELRRAKIFALAYATAKVAFKLNVLDKDQFGDIKAPLMRAWRDHGVLDGGPIDDANLAAFLADKTKNIADITATGKTDLNDGAFSKVDAFFYRERGGNLLMLMSRESLSRNLGFSKTQLSSLKARGILKTNEKDKLTVKICVRTGGVSQAFYAFRLRDMPEY